MAAEDREKKATKDKKITIKRESERARESETEATERLTAPAVPMLTGARPATADDVPETAEGTCLPCSRLRAPDTQAAAWELVRFGAHGARARSEEAGT